MTRSIDIERLLIWTYQRQLADLILGHGVDLWQAEREAAGIEWHGHSVDSVYTLLCRLRLGVRVDASCGWFFADVPPDAIAVHEAVTGLGQGYAPLIICHARSGTRPEWYPNAWSRYEPQWKNGPRYDPRTGWPVRRRYEIIQVWCHGGRRRFITNYWAGAPDRSSR